MTLPDCRSRAGRPALSRVTAVALVALLVVVAVAATAAYRSETPPAPTAGLGSAAASTGPLILYAADAYALEGQSLLQAFSTQTGVAVAPPRAGGSLALARQIAQGDPVSVFMTVSRTSLLPQYLEGQSSGWAVGLAADQMTLAYSNASVRSPAAASVVSAYTRAAASNSSADWLSFFSALTSGEVKVGISNPNADPAGFRGWIVLEAAGGAYANSSDYFVHRVLASSGNVTGSSAANLVAPLEAGQIQFLFIYRSAAASQGLDYLALPGAVNLGDPAMATFYSEFSYATSGGVERGSPIVLYMTVPRDSTDFADSVMFVSFAVQNGRSVLGGYHLSLLSPAILYNDTAVPPGISSLLASGLLTPGGAP